MPMVRRVYKCVDPELINLLPPVCTPHDLRKVFKISNQAISHHCHHGELSFTYDLKFVPKGRNPRKLFQREDVIRWAISTGRLEKDDFNETSSVVR